MQTVRMPWHWAALSLGALSLLLLLHGVTPFLGPYSHPVM